MPDAPSWPAVLLAWNLDPLPLAAVVAGAIGYGWLRRRVDGRHPRTRVPARKRWAWALGLGTVGLALLSPVNAYASSLLATHMLQHVLLQFVAAPLLVLAAPVTLVLRAAGPATRSWLVGLLHSRVLRIVTFPLLTWVLFAAVNWGWHFSSLYDQALEEEWLHVV